MIVFKTAREAVVASDKVNARRGPRYGLYAAETIFGDAVNQLADGVPLVLNKHYHRLVPDPDGTHCIKTVCRHQYCLSVCWRPRNSNGGCWYLQWREKVVLASQWHEKVFLASISI